jgi:hypothetical protein
LGAFPQTEQDADKSIHIKLRAKMATLLAEINPEKYKPYLCTEGGKPVICMKLKKCLYGKLRASVQFWKDLSGILQEWGFKLNMTNVWPTKSYAESSALSYGMFMT